MRLQNAGKLASHLESISFCCLIKSRVYERHLRKFYSLSANASFSPLFVQLHDLLPRILAHTHARSHARTHARTHAHSPVRAVLYSLASLLTHHSRYCCQLTYQNLVVDLLHLFTLITQIIQFLFVFTDKRLHCWANC